MTVKIVSPNNLERFAQKADEKFAEASHTHSVATITSAGFMSAEDKQNLNDLVQNGGESIHYVENPTGTAGTKSVVRSLWVGSLSNVDTLYTGLTIAYKVPVAGINMGVTLNINNSGEHPILLNASTKLTAHYPVDSILILVYDADASVDLTIDNVATTFTGCWKISNYDANTTYSSMSAAEATTGTATTARTISAKVLNDKIDEKISGIDTGVQEITTGSANGTISVDGTDVAVKGLGNAAYTSSTNYLGASATAADSSKLGGVAAASYAKLASPALTGTPTAPTASSGTNTTQIATTAFVQSAIDTKIAAADAMIYKGTIGTSSSTITTKTLPNSTAKTGWTYKVAEAGSYTVGTGTTTGTTTITCEVGDMLICLTDGSSSTYATWTVVQNNIDGAVTGPSSAVDARVAVFNGTTGKVIKDSGFTIGKSVPSNAVFTDTDTKVTSVGNHYAPSADSSSALTNSVSSTGNYAKNTEYSVVTGITVSCDAKGHVTGINTTNQKIKDTNTTYSSKTAANGGTDVSLVTTGEKYTWNNKSNLTIGTTATTAAAGNHTHTASLATDSGTATVTLAHNTTYKLTAGGSSIIFKTPADNNTTYSNMTAATADAAGKAGLVPAPAAGKQASFLRGDGTWVVPTDTDTKNTAGSTDSTSKLYLIGATSQAANPQTYSFSGTYIQNGAFTTTGAAKAASFQATSDIRKKYDIVEVKDIDLSSLKAFEYNLNGMKGRFTGLIAQEVEKVLPSAVKLDDEGFLSLDYNAIVAVLVNKVNQLEARISELENK